MNPCTASLWHTPSASQRSAVQRSPSSQASGAPGVHCPARVVVVVLLDGEAVVEVVGEVVVLVVVEVVVGGTVVVVGELVEVLVVNVVVGAVVVVDVVVVVVGG